MPLEQTASSLGRQQDLDHLDSLSANSLNVSAGAKIAIVPIDNAATPEALIRTDSGNRGGTACAQGKRRGRDQRAQAARLEHPGDQSLDGLRSGNYSEIFVEADRQADMWTEAGGSEQARAF
jgi:hypothetical protein